MSKSKSKPATKPMTVESLLSGKGKYLVITSKHPAALFCAPPAFEDANRKVDALTLEPYTTIRVSDSYWTPELSENFERFLRAHLEAGRIEAYRADALPPRNLSPTNLPTPNFASRMTPQGRGLAWQAATEPNDERFERMIDPSGVLAICTTDRDPKPVEVHNPIDPTEPSQKRTERGLTMIPYLRLIAYFIERTDQNQRRIATVKATIAKFVQDAKDFRFGSDIVAKYDFSEEQ